MGANGEAGEPGATGPAGATASTGSRGTDPAAPDPAALGERLLAMVVPAGSAVASGCTAVLIASSGRTRRPVAGAKVAIEPGETAWLFRPGPYQFEVRPFAAAAELGLRLSLVIDAADPRAQQQRFDLYLASEVQGERCQLEAVAFCAAIEGAVQRELALGHLALPPCTTLDEWNSFRAGLNRLLYLRFGVTVDACLPVDLGDRIDYAAMLAALVAAGVVEAAAAASPVPAAAPPAALPTTSTTPSTTPANPPPTANPPPPATAPLLAHAPTPTTPLNATTAASPAIAATPATPAPPAIAATPVTAAALTTAATPAARDAAALRRLFLELPCLMGGWRAAVLPRGALQFRRQQALLRRLDLVSLAVSTMPALALAAPGVPLAAAQQVRRASHSVRACVWLDDGWALLARLQLAHSAPGAVDAPAQRSIDDLFDEAERIVANLECDVGERRALAAAEPAGAPS